MTMRPTERPGRDGRFPGTGIAMVLPDISTNVLSGLIEAIAAPPYSGKADLPLIGRQPADGDRRAVSDRRDAAASAASPRWRKAIFA